MIEDSLSWEPASSRPPNDRRRITVAPIVSPAASPSGFHQQNMLRKKVSGCRAMVTEAILVAPILSSGEVQRRVLRRGASERCHSSARIWPPGRCRFSTLVLDADQLPGTPGRHYSEKTSATLLVHDCYATDLKPDRRDNYCR